MMDKAMELETIRNKKIIQSGSGVQKMSSSH